jgi:hypothetical protein
VVGGGGGGVGGGVKTMVSTSCTCIVSFNKRAHCLHNYKHTNDISGVLMADNSSFMSTDHHT